MKFETLCLTETEFLVPGQMANVRGVPGDEIVDRDDAMTFCQKPVYEMGTEKTRTSGDDRNRLRIFGH